jgi:hypothetical protein
MRASLLLAVALIAAVIGCCSPSADAGDFGFNRGFVVDRGFRDFGGRSVIVDRGFRDFGGCNRGFNRGFVPSRSRSRSRVIVPRSRSGFFFRF